jgi:hypothetical protein
MASRISKLRRENYQRQCFGAGEWGLDLLPGKLGSLTAARIRAVTSEEPCKYCFPHGRESFSLRVRAIQRSWKSHRKTQYRDR